MLTIVVCDIQGKIEKLPISVRDFSGVDIIPFYLYFKQQQKTSLSEAL